MIHLLHSIGVTYSKRDIGTQGRPWACSAYKVVGLLQGFLVVSPHTDCAALSAGST